MSRSSGVSLLLGSWLALSACAPAKAPAPPVQKPVPKAAAVAPGPRERLAQALRSIPRPAPVLAALPPSALSRLQARFAGLDAERKQAVQTDDGPLVETLPLLHLAAGGTSPRALYALCTSSAGSLELAGILGIEHDTAARTPDSARVAIVRELARRAALDFLRDRAADVAQRGKGTALASHLVARAALAVGRRDLVLGARELLQSVEPSAVNRLEFAAELARSGDAARASSVLAEARADKRRAPPPAALADTQFLIEMAQVANVAEAPADVSSKLQRARAWLRLGRVDQARALLESEAGPARARLDLAAALSEALIDNPACPDLPPDVGGAALCATSFLGSEDVKRARALLDAAWQTGAGRDDEAVEMYAALAHVLPLMHETASDLAQDVARPEESVARITRAREKLAQISLVAPKIAGLVLFIETFHAPKPTDARGTRLKDAKVLVDHALSLANKDKSRFAQAGVLAVAGKLAHEWDVSPLVDALSVDDTAANLRLTRASLDVWLTATTGSRERLETVRSELATVMTEDLGTSLERARLVLGVSEVGALLDPTERSYQLLSRVSGQLLSDNIPPEVALRAVLDASGALAQGQRYEQAAKILSSASTAELPGELSRARDLLGLIRGYQLVLGARAAPASSLPRLRTELTALAASTHGAAAAVWFELWNREFDALQREAECAKKKLNACAPAQALRRNARRDLDARLGTQASAVLMRGALPIGQFEAGFRFSVEKGLEPLLIFDPSVLSIGLPKFSAD
jgi:hypothetical protein